MCATRSAIFEQIFGSKYIEKLLGIVNFSVLFEISNLFYTVYCFGVFGFKKISEKKTLKRFNSVISVGLKTKTGVVRVTLL